MQMRPGQAYHAPPQPPPQAQRNDCADCYVGRPHMHDGSSSDNGNSSRVMAQSDPAHAYPCGAATGVGFVGARQNDGVVFLVDTAGHVICRVTRYGITTFADTGYVSNAQPGSYSRHLGELAIARQPQQQGPLPGPAPRGGQRDPRRAIGTAAYQPDSRGARGIPASAPASRLPTNPPPGGPRS
jgi:hypothetical protein